MQQCAEQVGCERRTLPRPASGVTFPLSRWVCRHVRSCGNRRADGPAVRQRPVGAGQFRRADGDHALAALAEAGAEAEVQHMMSCGAWC